MSLPERSARAERTWQDVTLGNPFLSPDAALGDRVGAARQPYLSLTRICVTDFFLAEKEETDVSSPREPENLRVKIIRGDSHFCMDEKQKEELWLRSTSVWRNILSHVLEWPEERINQFIEELRQEMEATFENPQLDPFGFFYDSATRDLFRPILGSGLHERIMQCKSDEANPSVIFQRLVDAITDNQHEWEMEKPDFDWTLARQRYQSERREVEEWLTSLEQ